MPGLSTKSVHAGQVRDHSSGSVATPIYESSTFSFRSTRQLLEIMRKKRRGNVYTRWWNPTIEAAERKIVELEEADGCLVFSSGMAAISGTVLTVASSGDHVVAVRDLYGATYELFTKVCPRFGIDVTLVDTLSLEAMRSAVRKKTRLIYVETPTNPLLRIVNLDAVAEIARKAGVLTAVDNTYATPYNQQPLKHGFDIVLHSATKYLAGHADVTAGAVATSKDLLEKIWETRKILGGNADPLSAWLLLRGMKTLAVRMERHNRNGMQVARFLARHPRVRSVYYPGLQSNPNYSVARRQMRGFGGMVSFEPKGGSRTASRIVDRLKLPSLAPSLGSVETLVSQPWTLSHWFVPKRDREKIGIKDELIRLSVGIEDASDIIADLDQALRKA